MFSRALLKNCIHVCNCHVQNIKIREGKENQQAVEIAHFVNYREKYTICDLVQFPRSHL